MLAGRDALRFEYRYNWISAVWILRYWRGPTETRRFTREDGETGFGRIGYPPELRGKVIRISRGHLAADEHSRLPID